MHLCNMTASKVSTRPATWYPVADTTNVHELVHRFHDNRSQYMTAAYNVQQTRTVLSSTLQVHHAGAHHARG